MGTLGAGIIGFIIGSVGGFVGLALFSSKNSGIRESARNIQLYCDELDCYECDFRRADGTCKLNCPTGWTLDKTK